MSDRCAPAAQGTMSSRGWLPIVPARHYTGIRCTTHRGQGRAALPSRAYRFSRQYWPVASSFTGQYHDPARFVLWCIRTPCAGHVGGPSTAGAGVDGAGALAVVIVRGYRARTASSRARTASSSVPRNVSCAWRPPIVMKQLTLAGASGSGGAGTAGEAAGWPVVASGAGDDPGVVPASARSICAVVGAGAWPLAGASSGARTRAVTRLARPAAMRCLHQPEGALG